MKRWLSALLLMVMLAQALPMSAMASVGRVLSDEELDRAYALTGLGKGDGLYHNGMALNESMNGMQLVGLAGGAPGGEAAQYRRCARQGQVPPCGAGGEIPDPLRGVYPKPLL